MARPSNTDERRQQITAGLRRVMAKRGYDGASITDIAKAARLTPGLLHYHFKSKQEILLALLDELVGAHRQALEARLALANREPRAELAAFVDFHLGLGADADPERLACWILLTGEALRDSKVRVRLDQALASTAARLGDLIGRGVSERVFVCDSPEVAAAALLACVQGYFVLAATARTLIPKGSAAIATKRMAAGLLGFELPRAPKERSQ